MKKIIISGLFAFALVAFAPSANAQSSTDPERMAALLQQLQALTAQVQQLQAQLAEMRGQQVELRTEIREQLRSDIREGMSDDDITKIQEVLASDPEVYPEGITSGYFGPLTKQALRRFQAKYRLEVTGEVDEETRAALETILEARFGEGEVPPGLLNAPGVKKKFEMRLREGCDNSGPGKAPFCQKIRVKYELDDDEDDDEDEDEDEDEEEDEDESEDEDENDDDEDDDDDEDEDDDDDDDDDDEDDGDDEDDDEEDDN